MQSHTISRRTKNTKARQVGRGGTRGKTSGKGTKGQNARSGRKKRPEIRDVIKRLPKLRGRGKNSNKTIETKPVAINLVALRGFSAGDTVSPETLVKKGIVKTLGGALPKVKILSNGEVSVALTFVSCAVSEGARKKIEGAGGTIK
jgi:large subunit ribosomal protein L15